MSKNILYIICLFVFVGTILISCSSKVTRQEEFDIEKQYTTNNADTNETQRRVRNLVIKGSTLQQQGRAAEAILEFMEASTLDSSASILYAIAKSYKDMGKISQAFEYNLKVLRKDSTFIDAYELMVSLYLLQEKIDDAIKVYHKIYELEPVKSRKLTLAGLYEYFNKNQKAISLYEEVIRDEGEDVNVLNRLAELYRKAQNSEKYISTLETIYSATSEDYSVAISLMQAYLMNKSYDKAVKMLNNLDNSVPTDILADSYALFGNWLLEDTTDATKAFSAVFVKGIENKFNLNWRLTYLGGFLTEKMKDSVQSEMFFKQTVKLADTIPDIPFRLGLHYFIHRRYNEAIVTLKSYESKFPKDIRYPLYIGLSYSLVDNNLSAIAYLRDALKIDSSNIDALGQIGLIYDRLKQYDSSDYFYETALNFEPNDPLINNNYAYSLIVRNTKLDLALSMINLAITREPLNPSYLDTYAWIQFKLENHKKALEYIEKAIANGGSSYEVYDHLGDIQYILNNFKEAEAAWKKAIEKSPDNSEIIQKLNKLK